MGKMKKQFNGNKKPAVETLQKPLKAKNSDKLAKKLKNKGGTTGLVEKPTSKLIKETIAAETVVQKVDKPQKKKKQPNPVEAVVEIPEPKKGKKSKKGAIVAPEPKVEKPAVQEGGKKNKRKLHTHIMAVSSVPKISKKLKKADKHLKKTIQQSESISFPKMKKKKSKMVDVQVEQQAEPTQLQQPKKIKKKIKQSDSISFAKMKKKKSKIVEQQEEPTQFLQKIKKAAAAAPVSAPAPTTANGNAKKNKKLKQEVPVAPVVVPEESNKKGKKPQIAAAQKNTGKGAPVKSFQKGKKQQKGGQPKEDEVVEVADLPSFDEDTFKTIVTHDNVLKVLTGLNKILREQIDEKKKIIFTDHRYMIDVTYHKIPNCPKRMVKLNLKHSLVKQGEDDIAIVVKDLKRGKRLDHEPTIHHYEDLFREKGIEGLTIIPFNQLKNEYNTFEMKRKLAALYDYYMCEGKISGHVVGFLGSIFQKPRCTFHTVRMNDHNNLKGSIAKSLMRTSYKQLHKGSLISIPIGTHKLNTNQLADNIMTVVAQLKQVLPGGWANIRNIYVKIDMAGTSSLPIFISAEHGPEETPYTIGPKEQKMAKLKRETKNELTKFEFTMDGKLKKLSAKDMERKRKIQEAKAGEAEPEEVQAKKSKTDKKQKLVKKEIKEEKEEEDDVEELVRPDEGDSDDEEGAVELLKDGEEFDDEEDEEDSEDDEDDDDEEDSD